MFYGVINLTNQPATYIRFVPKVPDNYQNLDDKMDPNIKWHYDQRCSAGLIVSDISRPHRIRISILDIMVVKNSSIFSSYVNVNRILT